MTEHKKSRVSPHHLFGGGFACMAALAGLTVFLFCFSPLWSGQASAGETKPFNYTWSISIDIPEMDNPKINESLKDWVQEFVTNFVPGDTVAVNLGEDGGSLSITGKPEIAEVVPGYTVILFDLTITSKAGPGEEEKTSEMLQVLNFEQKTGKRLFLTDLFKDTDKAIKIISKESLSQMHLDQDTLKSPPKIYRFDTFIPREDGLLVFFNPEDVSFPSDHTMKIGLDLKDLKEAGLIFQGWK